MNELIEEHKTGRNIVSNLIIAKESFTRGYYDATQDVIARLVELVNFYPKHIDKEDNHFFFPILQYFTEDEQQHMLEEFDEFDKSFIHEKYEELVEEFEREKR